MINTWEELRTRRPKSFIDPFWPEILEKPEEEQAEILDHLLTLQYGEEVNVYRYELAQKRKAEELERRKQSYLDSRKKQKLSPVKRIRRWFQRKRKKANP